VGRDGNTSGGAPLYFGTRANGARAAVDFRDGNNADWNLEASYAFSANHWYAMAATSDGSTLKLYIKDITDGDTAYTLLKSLDISASSSPVLSIGSGDGGDWDAGNFSIGRGLYNGGHVDRIASGSYIDDVRLSTAALGPSQFLYSIPVPPQLGVVGDGTRIVVTWPASHTGWRLLAQTNPPGQGLGTNWTEVIGSTLSNEIAIPISSTNGSFFLRLASP